jgi:hypothetical protein
LTHHRLSYPWQVVSPKCLPRLTELSEGSLNSQSRHQNIIEHLRHAKKISGVRGLAPDRTPSPQKGIPKCFWSALLTKVKTVADPFGCSRRQRVVGVVRLRFAHAVVVTAGRHPAAVVISPRVDRRAVKAQGRQLTSVGVGLIHLSLIGIGQPRHLAGRIVICPNRFGLTSIFSDSDAFHQALSQGVGNGF